MLIIDGNNLLGYYGKDRSPNNINWIIRKLKEYQKKQKIKLYFDGLSPFGEHHYSTNSNFKIIWVDKASGLEADDAIIAYVRSLKNSKEAVVVTNDKRIIMEVASLSQTMSCQDLIHKIDKRFTTDINKPTTEKDELIKGIDIKSLETELLEVFKKKMR